MNIDTIIVDLDRTLLNTDKTISPYTAAVLKDCQKRAIRVIAATARPQRTAEPFCRTIPFDGMVVANGARILFGGKKTEYGICPQSARRFLDALALFPDLTVTLETGDCAYSNRPVADYETVICKDMSAIVKAEGALKILVHIDSPQTLAIVKKELTEDLYCTLAHGYLLQIMDRSATKWNGIQEILRACNSSPNRTAYFGDDFDDLEPIQKCGMGIAVANAIAEVKAAADCIADTNDQDGVARFIEQHFIK